MVTKFDDFHIGSLKIKSNQVYLDDFYFYKGWNFHLYSKFKSVLEGKTFSNRLNFILMLILKNNWTDSW